MQQQEFDTEPTRFYKIMRHLFPIILRLASSQARHFMITMK